MYPTAPTKPIKPIVAPAYGTSVLDQTGKQVGTVRYDANTGKDLTPAQVYKDFKTPTVDPSVTAIDSAIAYSRPNENPVNEDQIRQNYMAQFQKEIDAVNSVYANMLNQSMTQGKGRLGSSTAIQARSGLLGSDFGAAQTAQVEDANAQEARLIEAERASKIAEILGKARAGAADEIKAKREAQSKGLNDYIAFLGAKADRVKTNLATISKSILSQGLDIKDIDPVQLKSLAQQYGVSEGDLVASFGEEKKALEVEKAKQAVDLNKALPASAQEYEYAVKNGYKGTYNQYQTEDANRKAVIARAGRSVTGGLTPYQQFQASQSIYKTTENSGKAAKELQRQAKILNDTFNRYDSGQATDLNATSQAIITTFNKILDPTSVVRESEYDRSPQGQALIDNIAGRLAAITQGGPGLTKASLKELVDLGNVYSKNAQASLDAANKRAELLAKHYGIDPALVGVGGAGAATDPFGILK